MHTISLTTIKANEISRLNKLIQSLEDFKTDKILVKSVSFSLKDVPNIETWDNLIIYYFEINEKLTKHELDRFWKDLESEWRKYAKQNRAGMENENILYVGSSHGFWRRFKEHCGLWYKWTYSLQMNTWIDTSRVITVNYIIVDNVFENILQLLEDALYDELKPLFGKKWKK